MSRRRAAFWFLFAVTLAVYLAMLGWSLPRIAAAAGGLTPFDLRPAGYSFADARAFLAALTPDGSAFYRAVQHRLDLFYPGLMAATLFFAIALLTPARWGAWRWPLAATAIPGAAFDYLENGAVATMLRLGPDGITPEIVDGASRWTVLKSQSTTVAMAILIALLLMWTGRRLSTRLRGA